MKRAAHAVIRYLLLVVPLGIVLGLLLQLLKIPKERFYAFAIPGVLLMILAMLGINLAYYWHYGRKLRTAAKLLDAQKPLEFLEIVEPMYARAKGAARTVIAVNLGAGYANLKQFDKAIAIMKRHEACRMSGAVRTAYQFNLCYCYFYAGRYEEAITRYQRCQKDFALFETGKWLGGSLAVLRVFVAIAEGNRSFAKAQLKRARETWTDSRYLEDFAYLEGQLQELERQETARLTPSGGRLS